MTQDFSKTYRGVQHFGLAFEETADFYGIRDAMAILANGVASAGERDLREYRDVAAALSFLLLRYDRLPAARAYQAALAIDHPVERREAARQAYNRLSERSITACAPTYDRPARRTSVRLPRPAVRT